MKLFYSLIILFFFCSCSFDNKTGIWINEDEPQAKDQLFKDFETLISKNSTFDKIIDLNENFEFKLSQPIDNYNWKDIFFSKTNNYQNFRYLEKNEILLKSKKITKHKSIDYILFENDNIITSDQKGNIKIFSTKNKKIINEFNFYKKRYKRIKKSLNIIVDNNILFISDNLGYLYSYNYKTDKILWAKNYKVPFRSNLKLSDNKLILADQNNNLVFINKENGENIKLIPTEETSIQNQFINNLSLNDNSVIFLNTYGSLYSINLDSLRINWFINLNQSFDLNPSNLFDGSKVVSHNGKIYVSSSYFTYVIDANVGSVIYKFNFSSKIKPIILDNYLFLISKKNLLISMDLIKGEVIYSYDINNKISELLNTKKKKAQFKNIFIVNSNIFIFSNNSHILKFDIRGNLKKIEKLKFKMKTHPIFINSTMMYLSLNDRLIILS
tara:strand:- start:5550 stop:6872 length:1323 start_codon:yes stop_codon:yes gene_type:complete